MKAMILAAVGLLVGLPASAEEPATCPARELKTASALLRVSGSVRVRLTTASDRLEGAFSDVSCNGLEFTGRAERSRKTLRFDWSDIKRLEVGRPGIAGWKGAVIGVAIGSALGVALRSSHDSAARGAIMGGLVFGVTGATWPRTSWEPVPITDRGPGM